jgi:cytochrome c peroxidase
MFARSSAAAVCALLVAACADGSDSEPSGPDDGAPLIGDEERALLASLSPAVLPAPAEDASNLWADDADAARFGQRLFFYAGFSGELLDGDNDGSVHALGTKGETGKVSCAGCHVAQSAFSDTRSISQQVSLGAGWGLRRAPSLLDVGQSTLLMWDGRKDSLFSQPAAVFESEVEMNSSRLFVAYQVFADHRAEYEAIFEALPPLDDASRFPPLAANETGCRRLDADLKCTGEKRGQPGDGAEFDGLAEEDKTAVTRVVANVGKALGAYQRLLACGSSRFDQFMSGDTSALSPAEQRGALLFVGKADCIRCHSGPFLSDEKFHNVGLKPERVSTTFIDLDDPGASRGFEELMNDPLNVEGEYSDGDDGRVPETIPPEMLGAFRTPRLRCVGERPSFMHTAQLVTLEAVIKFFNRGGDPFGFLGVSELTPLGLSAEEESDLIAFLLALEGPGPDAALLGPP